MPNGAEVAERALQQRACAPGKRIRAIERNSGNRVPRVVERDTLPNPLRLRLEHEPGRQRNRIAALDRSREGAPAYTLVRGRRKVMGGLAGKH